MKIEWIKMNERIVLSVCSQDMADYIAYVAKDLFNQRGDTQIHLSLWWAGSPLDSSLHCFIVFMMDQASLSPSVSLSACHILECPQGRAGEVINSIGQAFETRFRQLLNHTPSLLCDNPRLSFWLLQLSYWWHTVQLIGPFNELYSSSTLFKEFNSAMSYSASSNTSFMREKLLQVKVENF